MPAPIVLRVPDPCLVVLVGAAGAGKSTFAGRHFAPDEVLSSDEFRALIAGDQGDQAATGAAFVALHRALGARLRRRLLTVVDATSVQARARGALLRQASVAGVPAVAIVLDVPADVVLDRNAGRGAAAVPERAVRSQLADLAAALADGSAAWDGFAEVHHLGTTDSIDRVRIVRVVSDSRR